VDDALARQVLRQRTARRPLALEAFYLDLRRSGCRGSQPGLRLGFGSILFQIGELKLELFEDGAALGGLAVLLVARARSAAPAPSPRPPRSAPSPPRQGAPHPRRSASPSASQRRREENQR
jgi:hypothetical protein